MKPCSRNQECVRLTKLIYIPDSNTDRQIRQVIHLGFRVKKLLRLCWPFFAGVGVAPPDGLRLAELLEAAGVDLAVAGADGGAVGAGLAEAEVEVDLDSACLAACCLGAPLLDPVTTGAASDSSDEYDSYSSSIFVTVYPRSSLDRTFLVPILRFFLTLLFAAVGADPFIVSVTVESAISTSGSRSLP